MSDNIFAFLNSAKTFKSRISAQKYKSNKEIGPCLKCKQFGLVNANCKFKSKHYTEMGNFNSFRNISEIRHNIFNLKVNFKESNDRISNLSSVLDTAVYKYFFY